MAIDGTLHAFLICSSSSPCLSSLYPLHRREMTATIQRPLKGSRISTFYPVKELPPLASLDSAFQLQEYISLLVRKDPHDVEAITSLPGQVVSPKDPSAGEVKEEAEKVKSEVTVDQWCWVYEQIRYVFNLVFWFGLY